MNTVDQVFMNDLEARVSSWRTIDLEEIGGYCERCERCGIEIISSMTHNGQCVAVYCGVHIMPSFSREFPSDELADEYVDSLIRFFSILDCRTAAAGGVPN